MPAAVAVPAIMGAAGIGAQLYGAKRASDASKKAADTQVRASQQAMGSIREANAPYLALGGGAANTLGRLMQSGQPYSPQMQRQDSTSGAMQGRPGAMPGQMPPQAQWNGFGRMMAPGLQPGGPGGPQGPRMGQGGGRMVKLQAPTGETMDVPEQQVPQFVQKGARVIG